MIAVEPPLWTETFPNRKRFTRDECDFMERTGTLTGRYELIDGEIINKMGQNRPHAVIVVLVTDYLSTLFGGQYVQCQLPIEVAIADRTINYPEPDVSVLTKPVTAFSQNTPEPSDLRLVVEVSDSTLVFDLRIKAALYARAGIVEYWVLDAIGRRLFAHRDPTPQGYQTIVTYMELETIAPLTAPNHEIVIAHLLPPVAPEK